MYGEMDFSDVIADVNREPIEKASGSRQDRRRGIAVNEKPIRQPRPKREAWLVDHEAGATELPPARASRRHQAEMEAAWRPDPHRHRVATLPPADPRPRSIASSPRECIVPAA